LTPIQRDLARHALGLPNASRRNYRNYFVTGPGSDDYDNWCEMVTAGYATRRAGSPLTGGDDLFKLTEAGARAALDPRETSDVKDFAGVA
jgi:hypothetical protein